MADHVTKINGGIEAQAAFFAQTGEWENGPFYNGFQALYLSGAWEVFMIQDYMEGVDVGISIMPHGPHGESRPPAYGGWGYAVPKGAPHPDEGWLLVEWLTAEQDGACWFTQQQKRPSPLISCNEDPASAEWNPWANGMIESMKHDVFIPITPVQPQIEETVDKMVDTVLYGQSAAQQALDQAAKDCQALLDEHWSKKDS